MYLLKNKKAQVLFHKITFAKIVIFFVIFTNIFNRIKIFFCFNFFLPLSFVKHSQMNMKRLLLLIVFYFITSPILIGQSHISTDDVRTVDGKVYLGNKPFSGWLFSSENDIPSECDLPTQQNLQIQVSQHGVAAFLQFLQ